MIFLTVTTLTTVKNWQAVTINRILKITNFITRRRFWQLELSNRVVNLTPDRNILAVMTIKTIKNNRIRKHTPILMVSESWNCQIQEHDSFKTWQLTDTYILTIITNINSYWFKILKAAEIFWQLQLPNLKHTDFLIL